MCDPAKVCEALADHLEAERPGDAAARADPAALFLPAASITARRAAR
ncbi:hypothetical protein [Streptosporangium pseudovulgare]|uniref:Uncharacterized protein n=1 Tax=Streptosporangium pseudovulgare TaxID=35765 RepID=A0ABQ2RK47_9ACTN|nr:hypothetical protein [Streptosporangium pseudovulgare]GGQ32220.1 hypothetical protein GCM10010140_72900 [Streptosporangium pseudovulgare]